MSEKLEIEKKYEKELEQFKYDLNLLYKKEKLLSILIIKTYSASKLRTHIYKIIEFLGFNHSKAYNEYINQLHGKMLCGNDNFFHTMRYVNMEFFQKYTNKIPEQLALKTAYTMAVQIENNQNILNK